MAVKIIVGDALTVLRPLGLSRPAARWPRKPPSVRLWADDGRLWSLCQPSARKAFGGAPVMTTCRRIGLFAEVV